MGLRLNEEGESCLKSCAGCSVAGIGSLVCMAIGLVIGGAPGLIAGLMVAVMAYVAFILIAFILTKYFEDD